MANCEKQNQVNERKVYIRNSRQWVSVSEEVYKEYYRPIWRTQKEERKNGRCDCPVYQNWQCDGDCFTCSHHLEGNTTSLDAPIENAEDDEISLIDTIADPNAISEEILTDRLLLDDLLTELAEHDPEGKRICELFMEGQSIAEIAETLQLETGDNWYKSKADYHEKQALAWLRKHLAELS